MLKIVDCQVTYTFYIIPNRINNIKRIINFSPIYLGTF